MSKSTRVHETQAGRLSRIGLAVCFLAGSLLQAQQQAEEQAPRRISGLLVANWASYVGAYSLLYPQVASYAGPRSSGMLEGGTGLTLDGRLFLRRVDLLAVYSVDGFANARFEDLRGVNQSLRLEVTKDRAGRTGLSLELFGETRLMSSLLLNRPARLSLLQSDGELGAISERVLDEASSSIRDTPLALMVGGIRRRLGAAYMTVTHRASSRTEMHIRTGAFRDLRGTATEETGFPSSPSVTVGAVDVQIAHSLTPRLRLSAGSAYRRSYSAVYRFAFETATLGLDRTIGRRSFSHVEGGFAWTHSLGSASAPRRGYTAAATLGTRYGSQSMMVSGRRGVADIYGFGADTTIGLGGAWSWQRPNAGWSYAVSFGYERLRGQAIGVLDAWIAHALVARRLSRHLRVEVDLAWANGSSGNNADFARRGIRIGLICVPGARGQLAR